MSNVLRDYQQKASDAAVSFFNNKMKKTNAIMSCLRVAERVLS